MTRRIIKKFLCVLGVFVVIIISCSKPIEPVNRPNQNTLPPASEKEKAGIPSDALKVIDELKKELGKDFIVGYEAPFVIAGNISQLKFDQLKDRTIKECAKALYKDYFDKKPDYILKVYLFKDTKTYEAYCEKTDGRKPSSPYGFYQGLTKSLIMNIATGGGTLVHEMVHALIAPDFPDVPAWFNEGLGSLYEQCRIEADSFLTGLINWRYKGLMDAVKADKLVPLKEIFSMTDSEFYGNNNRPHYAQARYFCLYMQEMKVLKEFYKKFRDGYSTDKAGIKFIEELFEDKIDQIDKNWQKWITTIEDIEGLR